MADGGEGKTPLSGIQIKIKRKMSTGEQEKKIENIVEAAALFGNFLFEGIHFNCKGLLYIS